MDKAKEINKLLSQILVTDDVDDRADLINKLLDGFYEVYSGDSNKPDHMLTVDALIWLLKPKHFKESLQQPSPTSPSMTAEELSKQARKYFPGDNDLSDSLRVAFIVGAKHTQQQQKPSLSEEEIEFSALNECCKIDDGQKLANKNDIELFKKGVKWAISQLNKEK